MRSEAQKKFPEQTKTVRVKNLCRVTPLLPGSAFPVTDVVIPQSPVSALTEDLRSLEICAVRLVRRMPCRPSAQKTHNLSIQYVLTSKLTMCISDADPGFEQRNQAITLLCSTIGANRYVLHMGQFQSAISTSTDGLSQLAGSDVTS